MNPLFRSSLTLVLALAWIPSSRSATYDWAGATPYHWDVVGNWTPPPGLGGPGPLDDAVFPVALPASKSVLTLNNVSRSIKSLSFAMSGTSFQIGGQGGFGSLTPQLNVGSHINQNSPRNVVINPDVICGSPFTLGGTGGGNVDFNGSFLGSPDLIVNGPGAHWFRIGASTAPLNFNSITLNGSTLEIGMSNTVNVAGLVQIDAGATLRLCYPGFSTATFNAPLVNVGGTLFGNTTVNATVNVLGGAIISAGCSPGTLIIIGNLTLSGTSVLDFELDTPGVVGGGVNDLIDVTGDLTLDGVLDVTALAGFGPGIYRLFNYTGILTDNGLALGSLASGYSYVISTATAGQVDLVVTPATPAGPISLVSTGTVWAYLDDGSDQGTAWKSPAFDDSGWSNGVCGFGAETPGIYPDPIRTPWPVGGGRITYYLRTHFNWSGSTAGAVLNASAYIDDGAAFHLNGVEAARVRLTNNPVLFDSLALNQGAEGTADVFTLSTANLLPGDNVLAVEVHQFTSNSSDVVFCMTLERPAPAQVITVTAHPGFNLIANPLNGTNNLLNTILPNVPQDSQVLKFLNNNYTRDDFAVGRWINSETLDPSTTTVSPGEGFFFYNPAAAAIALTFTGEPALPALPAAIVRGGHVLLSRRDLGPGTFANIVGLPPEPGCQFLTFNAATQSYSTNIYDGSTWLLGPPSIAVGESAFVFFPAAPPRIFINEWVANSLDCCPDPIDGQHDDWFEIYNPGSNAVNLAGYYVTPWSSNDFRFAIPPGYSVPARGFLRVFADNQPQQNTNTSPDLHVNFTLPNGGGSIGLYAADGTAIDAISFGPQMPDVSEGRFPDGGTDRYFMKCPTPRAPNVLSHTVSIVSGYNLIANPLDNGGNTMNEILPAVPEGTRLLKFNNGSQTYQTARFSFGEWDNPHVALHPGEGAWLQAPVAFNAVFCGRPRIPVLPINIPPGQCYLLSQQNAAVGTWESILGAQPPDEAMVSQWIRAFQNFHTSHFSFGSWDPAEPSLAIGESAWFCPVGGNPPPAPPPCTPFGGLQNCPRGNATLQLLGPRLMVSNIGTSGLDGVSIEIGAADRFHYTFAGGLHLNSPEGATIQHRLHALATNGQDQVVAIQTAQKSGTNILVGLAFPQVSASAKEVQLFYNHVLVASYVSTGGVDFQMQARLQSGGTTTYKDSTDKDIAIVCCLPEIEIEAFQLSRPTLATEIHVRPINPFPVGPISSLEITSAAGEAIALEAYEIGVLDHLVHSLGAACLGASPSNLAVGCLGTNGVDGVCIALDRAEAVTVSLAPVDPLGTAPVGSSLRASAIGSVNGQTNQSLGSLLVIWHGEDLFWLLPNFTAIGSTTQRIQVLSNGVHIADVAGHTGMVMATTWPTRLGKLGGSTECYASTHPHGTLFVIDGVTHQGDEIHLLAEGGGTTIDYKSAFEIRAAGIPEVVITGIQPLPAPGIICCTNPADNRLVNGSFESPAVSPNSFGIFASVPGWTGTASGGGPANIEFWNGTFGSMTPQEGQQHLEINASIANESVSQLVSGLTPGCPATFCFWYTGRPNVANNTFRAEIIEGASNVLASFTANPAAYPAGGWYHYATTFTPAAASITIRFTGASAPGYPGGAHIDNVCLAQMAQPTLVCAPSKEVHCGTPWSFDPPSLSGGCCSNLSLTVLSTVTNGSCPWAITRTWLATNACGYSSECSQSVTVVDITPPMLRCPEVIRITSCSNSVPVYYRVLATDTCDANVPVNCTPPSGSPFISGTTLVQCTAVDDCGNSNSCVFLVILSTTPTWQLFPAGAPDCYAAPNELATRGACLNTAYPGALWKNFDDPMVNRFLGHSWSLPNATYFDGYLVTRMEDFNCSGISVNDTINLGLLNCSPATWSWSRHLGPDGADPGLQPASWCRISNCNHLFNLHLSALPVLPSGTTNLLPLINTSFPRRLDLFVQDDTRVDFANLWLRRCPPQHVIGGLEATLTNAVLAHGSKSWTLAADPQAGSPASYGASLDLGFADSAALRLDVGALTQSSTGAVSVQLRSFMPDGGSHSLGCSITTNGIDGWYFTPTASSASGGSILTLRNQGGTVLTQTYGPDVLPPSLRILPPDFSITFQAGSNATLRLASSTEVSGPFGTFQADEIALSVSDSSTWIRGFCPYALEVSAAGVSEVALSQVQIGVAGIVDTADAQWDDWGFATVSGNALARVENGQLTLSALDAAGSPTMFFIFPQRTSVAGGGTNEFRATITTSFGQFSAVPSNASVRFQPALPNHLVDPVDGQHDDWVAISCHISTNGQDWVISASHSNAPLPLASAEVWNNGIMVAGVSNPVSVSVSKLPTVYWPSTSWFVDADICHRFPYPTGVTVLINGTPYVGDELRVLTATDTRITGFTGLRIETVGADALVLADLETGPVRHRLAPPILSGSDIIIRANTLGGVVECAATLLGPWTTVPSMSGEVRVSVTNAPAKYFRVKSN